MPFYRTQNVLFEDRNGESKSYPHTALVIGPRQLVEALRDEVEAISLEGFFASEFLAWRLRVEDLQARLSAINSKISSIKTGEFALLLGTMLHPILGPMAYYVNKMRQSDLVELQELKDEILSSRTTSEFTDLLGSYDCAETASDSVFCARRR